MRDTIAEGSGNFDLLGFFKGAVTSNFRLEMWHSFNCLVCMSFFRKV